MSTTVDFLSSPKRFTHQAIADGLGIARERRRRFLSQRPVSARCRLIE